MQKIYYILSIILLLGIITFSCDKIDAPYTRENSGGVSKGRKVLLEEFTGHKCPNCPTASKEAHELQDEYPEVILISVHAGTFATVSASGLFTYDFRTSVGDELNTFFNVSGYPSAMINRKAANNIQVPSPAQWASAIASFQDYDPIATLSINNTYDTTSREVSLSVKTEFLENYTNPLNLVVYLTEDSIIKPQYNNNPLVGTTPYIENYTHRHVLRGSVNGTWGSDLTNGSVTYGTVRNSSFNATLDTTWNDKHCYMVAFLTDIATNEVMQATEKKIR
ncbi:MAG: Omp28 family outer membrane lipoprotein [Bacteroidales bacterium]